MSGFDVVQEQSQVRRHIGLVFQVTTLDDYLTATENLDFHDTPEAIRASVGQDRVELDTADDPATICSSQDHSQIQATARKGRLLSSSPMARCSCSGYLPAWGVPVRPVRVARPNLDDDYTTYTWRTIGGAEATGSDKLRPNHWVRSRRRSGGDFQPHRSARLARGAEQDRPALVRCHPL